MRNIFAIRGAVGVDFDSPVMIDSAVGELFGTILERNALDPADISHIILSQTGDIKTKNAATSLRKTGLCDDIPLFCVQEAEITGMMDHVIRMMVVVGRPQERAVEHVYLGRAAGLRPDLSR